MKMRQFLYVAMMVGLNTALTAQWEKLPGPAGVEATFVTYLDSTIYVQYSGPGFYRSTDLGATWSQSASGFAPGTAVLSMRKFKNLLIAGTTTGLYESSDKGISWKSRGNLGSVRIEDIAVMDTVLFVLIAPGGTSDGIKTLWRSNDGGLLWHVAEGTESIPIGCIAAADTVCYFSNTHSTAEGSSYARDSLFFITVNNPAPTLFGGMHYTPIASIAACGTMVAVTAGTKGLGYNMSIRLSHNQGQTWFQYALLIDGASPPTEIKCTSKLMFNDSLLFAVNPSGIMGLCLPTAGLSLENKCQYSTPRGEVNDFIVAGTMLIAATQSKGLLFAKDTRSTALPIGAEYHNQSIRSFANTNEALVMTTSHDLYTSIKCGILWQQKLSGIFRYLHANQTMIFAGDYSWIQRTTDHGGQWSICALAYGDYTATDILNASYATTKYYYSGSAWYTRRWNFSQGSYKDCSYGLPFTGAVAEFGGIDSVIFAAAALGSVYRLAGDDSIWSTSGSNWPRNTIDYYPRPSFAAAGKICFHSVNGTGIYRTNDYGLTWTLLTAPPSAASVREVCSDGVNLFALVDGGILATTNKGETWRSVVPTMPQRKVTAMICRDGYLYLGTDTAGVWRGTIANVLLDVQPEEHPIMPAEFLLSQNYPNPFNPTTALDVTLPEASAIRVEVFDLLGRRVGLLGEGKYAAGSYHFSWNATGVPSGVYICRLTVHGNGSGDTPLMLSRKLVLLK